MIPGAALDASVDLGRWRIPAALTVHTCSRVEHVGAYGYVSDRSKVRQAEEAKTPMSNLILALTMALNLSFSEPDLSHVPASQSPHEVRSVDDSLPVAQ